MPSCARPDLAEDALREWLSTRLARFKQPRDIIFVDELPRLANGKLDRVTLQTWAEEGAAAMTQYGPLDDIHVFELYPDIQLTRDNIEHYRALARGKLVINRCHDCHYWIYPHRPLCPECLSWNVRPEEVSGYGQRLHVHPAAPAARSAEHDLRARSSNTYASPGDKNAASLPLPARKLLTRRLRCRTTNPTRCGRPLSTSSAFTP